MTADEKMLRLLFSAEHLARRPAACSECHGCELVAGRFGRCLAVERFGAMVGEQPAPPPAWCPRG